MKLDVEALLQDKDLASNYSVAIANAFIILGDLQYNEEVAWFAIRDTTVSTAKKIVQPKWLQHCPWLSEEALSILDKKKAARMKGDDAERHKLKGMFIVHGESEA